MTCYFPASKLAGVPHCLFLSSRHTGPPQSPLHPHPITLPHPALQRDCTACDSARTLCSSWSSAFTRHFPFVWRGFLPIFPCPRQSHSSFQIQFLYTWLPVAPSFALPCSRGIWYAPLMQCLSLPIIHFAIPEHLVNVCWIYLFRKPPLNIWKKEIRRYIV